MATCTPIYGLPYAEGSDPPCDINETLCEFAEAVEVQLDLLDAVVDRVADTVPMVQVKLTAPLTTVSGGNTTITVPFDSISVDTASMVALADNPYRITLPRRGRYLVSFQAQLTSAPLNDLLQAQVVGSGVTSNVFDQYISDSSTPVYLNAASEMRYTNDATADTTSAILTFTVAVLIGTYVIESATVCVTWIGDLP